MDFFFFKLIILIITEGNQQLINSLPDLIGKLVIRECYFV